jgi:hypothetical protein
MAIDFSGVAGGGSSRIGIGTGGTLVKIKSLGSGETPVTYTITGSASIGATTASLSASVALFVEKGSYLYFGSNFIIPSESKVIGTSATDIAIQPALATISGTCSTYGLLTLPTTNVNNNEEVATIPSKNHLLGEQLTEERLSRALKVSCELIVAPDDRAYFYEALPAALNKAGQSGKVYVAIAAPVLKSKNLYEFTFGTALVTVDGDANPVNELRRPSVTLNFQAPWLKTSVYWAEPEAIKALIDAQIPLCGLPKRID